MQLANHCIRATMALAILLACGRSARAEGQQSSDEELLRHGGVKTDGPSLLAYLKDSSVRRATASELKSLIEELGNDDFERREAASRKLVAAGPMALSSLQEAARGSDAEVASRAEACIRMIGQRRNPAFVAAVVRCVARSAPDGAVDRVLQLLPAAPDEGLHEEVCFALDTLVIRQGKVPSTVETALRDDSAQLRCAAGYLLARRGTPGQRALARKLLADTDASVRLRVAQGFLGAGEKDALPVLIELLAQAPIALAWQAEELLRYAAGEGEAPPPVLGDGNAPARAACRKAWAAWWDRRGGSLDLSQRSREHRRPALLIVWARAPAGPGYRIWLCGSDGVTRWQLAVAADVCGAHISPDGRILLLQWNIRERHPRPGETVPESSRTGLAERTPDGKLVWLYKGLKRPKACAPLAGGHIRVTDYDGEEHEIDARGVRVPLPAAEKASPLPAQAVLAFPYGNRLITTPFGGVGSGWSRVAEEEPSGRLVWELAKAPDDQARLCLQMVRLGFDAPRPASFDLRSLRTRVEGLGSKDAGVRRLCAWALGQRELRSDEGGRALVNALGDADMAVGDEAEKALREFVAAAETPLLAAMPAKNPRIRARAATLVGELFGPKPPAEAKEARRLVMAALRDENAFVRVRAIWSVWRFQDDPTDVVNALIAAFKDTAIPPEAPRDSVGQAAAQSFYRPLGTLGRTAQAAVPALLEAAESPDDRMCDSACMGLVGAGRDDDRVVPALVRMLHDPKRAARRWRLVWTLGDLRESAKAAVPDLLAVLPLKTDTSPEAKELTIQIIVALWEIGPAAAKPATPVLLDLLQDKHMDLEARRHAAVTLSRFGPLPEAAVTTLRQAIKDKNELQGIAEHVFMEQKIKWK